MTSPYSIAFLHKHMKDEEYKILRQLKYIDCIYENAYKQS
jgi:hypothetical protein